MRQHPCRVVGTERSVVGGDEKSPPGPAVTLVGELLCNEGEALGFGCCRCLALLAKRATHPRTVNVDSSRGQKPKTVTRTEIRTAETENQTPKAENRTARAENRTAVRIPNV